MALLFITSVTAILGVARLHFDLGFDQVFRSGSARYADLARLNAAFPPKDEFALLVALAPEPEAQPAFETFVIELHLLPGVAAVLSPFSSLGAAWSAGSGGDGVTEDGTQALITLLAEPGQVSVKDLEALAADYLEPAGHGLSISGLAAILERSKTILLTDFVRVNAIGAALALLLAAAFLPGWRSAVLTASGAGTALLWSMGTLGWLGVPINFLSFALPVLLLTLALSDVVHVALEHARMSQRYGEEALVHALRRIGPAAALTSATTALAFSTLGFSSSEVLVRFGLGGAVAVLMGCAGALSGYWAAGLVFRFTALPAPRRRLREPVALPLIKRVTQRPAAVSCAALLATGLAVAGLMQLEPRYALTENLPAKDSVRQTHTRIGTLVGANAAMSIPVLQVPPSNLGSDAPLRAVAEAMAGAGYRTLSALDLVAAANRQGIDLDDLRPDMPPALARPIFGAEGQQIVAVPFVYEGSAQTREATTKIEHALAQLDPALSAQVGAPTGPYVLSGFASHDLLSELARSLALAIALSGLVVLIWLRSMRAGLAAMVVNLMPVALVGAALWLAGGGLLFASAVSLILGFGIALDDTIHVFNRLRLRSSDPTDWPAQVDMATAEAMPALALTTALLCAGLIGTLFAQMPTIQLLGGICLLLFIAALLADSLVLPSLIKWGGK